MITMKIIFFPVDELGSTSHGRVSISKYICVYLMQEITGSIVKNCMLHYPMYRNIFPLLALVEYRKRVTLP